MKSQGRAARGHAGQDGQDGEAGQAVVEAAIILPAMIFLLLCTLQLTQLQQARIMVEYAAYTAARAGIVMNGNNGKSFGLSDGPMHDAAVLSILPSFGRTDSFGAITKSLAQFAAEDLFLKPFKVSQVQVAVLNPTTADFGLYGQHLNGKELDFDDVRPEVTKATLLSIQVRYLYEMKVPFANKLLQTLWMATQIGQLKNWQGWDLSSPRYAAQNGADAVGISRPASAGKTVIDGMPGGLPLAALVSAGDLRQRYFLPVNAWYTMRMQSNPYLKWAR